MGDQTEDVTGRNSLWKNDHPFIRLNHIQAQNGWCHNSTAERQETSCCLITVGASTAKQKKVAK